MWRGFCGSWMYSSSSRSVSARPNHVLCQNRNGSSTIAQATTKKRMRLRTDMRPRWKLASLTMGVGEVTNSLFLGIGVEHARLMEIMRHGVLRQQAGGDAHFRADPLATGVRMIGRVQAWSAGA